MPAQMLVRFEGVAGEFAQFDFGEVSVRLVDGTPPPACRDRATPAPPSPSRRALSIAHPQAAVAPRPPIQSP
ncbi:MAG: hypothetical protein Q8Q85_07255, partial [Gemmatimonadales bacterium]|nr:hypothetical protein [Gemmatimonadales bacterium]